MSEYGFKIEYIRSLSRPLIVLLLSKIEERKNEENIFQAKIHGAYKNHGLNTEGATPIEDILDRNPNFKM